MNGVAQRNEAVVGPEEHSTTQAESLAEFVARVSYDDLSDPAQEMLKAHILDALGCAVGGLAGEPIAMLQRQIEDFGGHPMCTLVGGGMTAPDRAAFYNTALIRYLDFNDSYLAPGETCHPSDNLGAVLAAGEYAGIAGRDLCPASHHPAQATVRATLICCTRPRPAHSCSSRLSVGRSEGHAAFFSATPPSSLRLRTPLATWALTTTTRGRPMHPGSCRG
jgi:MmgE/PrpD N-terminal domain